MCGAGDSAAAYDLIAAIAARDYAAIYGTVRDLVMSSRDLSVFFRELIEGYRDLTVMKTAKNAVEYLDLTDSEAERLRELSSLFTMEQLIHHSGILEDAFGRMQRAGASRRAVAELALTRLCDPKLSSGEEALMARISELENALALLRSGADLPPAPAPKAAKKPAPVKETAPAPLPPEDEPKAVAPPTAEKVSYRAFGGWREVTEELGRRNASMAAPLNGSSAAISSEGKLVVRVGNAFFLTLLNKEESLATIRAVASSLSGTPVASVEIQSAGAKKSDSILEELERALAENH